jgi:DNA-binding transcriptional ArsR family regulator
MGWWIVSADTLAASRFVISPLAETTASLMVLQLGAATHPGERAWLDHHRPGYLAYLAADPVAARTVRAALGRRWVADVLAPAPLGEGEQPFEAELARLRAATPEQVAADLEVSLGGPLPDDLRRPDLAGRLAGLLDWVWADCVRPYWPTRRRILEADIVARSARLGSGGWTAALDGMGPGIRWLGHGRLQINARNYPPRDISGSRLLFVPVTSAHGWVGWEEPHRYALIYPCAGVLARPDDTPVPAPLAALIGPGRARILTLLDSPKSTTQLVALTGLGLGSAGRHLKVLLSAGLVQRRRAGRSVLYYQTASGAQLVGAVSATAAGPAGTADRPGAAVLSAGARR